MQIHKVVITKKSLEKVFGYLSDFTTTTQWDPGTVITVCTKGDGSIGTEYLNTSIFAGRQTELIYVVEEFLPNQRIRLRGENKSVVATDTITFRQLGDGTEVTYTAEFHFKGFTRVIAPFMRSAFKTLGNEAEVGMIQALEAL